MKLLTDRQKEVLIFIAQFTEENTYPPTVREIAEHFSVSIRAVQDHIIALKKKGYIMLTQKRSRSIRVIKDIREEKDIPHVTKIPLLRNTVPSNVYPLSKENYESFVQYALPFVDITKEYFALTIQDEGLKDIGIFTGDIAVLCQDVTGKDEGEGEEEAQETEAPEEDSFLNGKLVAAVIDDSIVVRRYLQENSRVCLQPANNDFQPVYSQETKPLGVLVGIVRAY